MPPGTSKKIRFKSCFIAAPTGGDISAIKRALLQRGVRPIVPSELPLAGSSITEHLTKAIRDADMFIAVLNSETVNSDIYYEIGYAHALRKKSLILVSPSLPYLPSDVSELLYLRADSTNSEAISFALDQALAIPTQKKSFPKPELVFSRPIGRKADKYIQLLLELGERITEREIEEILVDVLKASGISIFSRANSIDRGADLAIWADELAPWVGNPLLIEIKKTVSSIEAANQLVYQVAPYISHTNSKWVLVVVGRSPSSLENFNSPLAGVILITLVELLAKIRRIGFGELIRDLRNKQLHGEHI